MPIEPATSSGRPSRATGSASVATTRSARARAPAASVSRVVRMANSSPPSRATRSCRADGLRQAAAHLDQQPVADRVAECVVDVLEPVEVEQQQREVPVGCAGRGQRAVRGGLLVHLGQQRLAVGQAGERVEPGQMLLLGGEPRHPVDREQRHEHQRDQRDAVRGGPPTRIGCEQQQRADRERTRRPRPGGTWSTSCRRECSRTAIVTVPYLTTNQATAATTHRGDVDPARTVAVAERGLAEAAGDAPGGAQRERVLRDVEDRAPRRVMQPPRGDHDRGRLDEHGGAETPGEQDREREADGREDRRLCRRPGGANGRESQRTASAAITQNAAGRSGSCCGQAGSAGPRRHESGHRDDRPDERVERRRPFGGNGVTPRGSVHPTSPLAPRTPPGADHSPLKIPPYGRDVPTERNGQSRD